MTLSEHEIGDDEVASRLIEISRVILGGEDSSQSLKRVLLLACVSIPGCDEASIGLLEDATLRTVATTSDAVSTLDELQTRIGEGPAVSAINDTVPVWVDSTVDDSRWPQFTKAAADAGFLSVQVFPVTNGEETLGAFNLYSRSPGTFDDKARRIGELFGQQAGVALHHARLHDSSVKLGEQLGEALVSRAVIDQAKGVLMERLACDAERAFEVLREASQRLNRKVRDLAHEIVQGAGRTPSK